MKKLTFLTLFMTMVITNVFADEVVTPPTGLTTETYVAILTTASGDTYYQDVNVGFWGESEVYMQGLSYNDIPESWVKGTLTNGGMLLEIPSTYLGSYSFWGNNYDITFNATNFFYTAATNTFYGPSGFSITGGVAAETYSIAYLKKLVEKATTPATPIIEFSKSPNGSTYITYMTIPLVDVNGDPMVSDKVSYILYYEKNGSVQPLTFTKDKYEKLTEDMTEIPYNFTDNYDIDNYQIWMNQGEAELKTWTKIGVQSIYRGGDAENKSEIAWFDLAAYWGTAIQNVNADNANRSGKIYNLNGQEMQSLKRGLNIVNGKKVFVK